uniref:Uncharacterized protein n=1 Tax=Gossypium raimondii TaxID=29730 RepID=A0A0D2UZQ5_GOSRA|nr:hypothetical protein B456_012G087100 [Gossypium raimondii]
MSSEWGTIIVGGRPGHRCSFLYNSQQLSYLTTWLRQGNPIIIPMTLELLERVLFFPADAIIVGWHKMSLKNSIKLAILGNSDGHMILTQNMKATKMQSFQPLNFLP